MNDYFRQLQTALATLDDDKIGKLQALIQRAIMRGGTVFVAGNGGSAAVAAHWACDLQKAAGIRCIALGTNTAIQTAWANDDGYAEAFAAELRTLGRGVDALVCLSCSGSSENIVRLLRQAWMMKIPRALITQAGRLHVTPIDVLLEIDSTDYGVLEDSFSAIGHHLTNAIRAERLGFVREVAV